MSASNPAAWSSSYRLVASEKWKAKSAALGSAVTESFVEYSKPLPNMRVLDLASGTGEPGISLAQRVGANVSVTAVDQSSELLAIASERARNKGLSNFAIQQADAHELPFPDQSFDLATCRFGVMFFSNVNRALMELRRVLKPGARACFVAWGPMEQPYWQCTMKIVHRHVGGIMLDPAGADPFRFGTARSLSKALGAAGFHKVEETPCNLPWTWPGNAEEVFEYACAVAAPFRPMLERVTAEDCPVIRGEAIAAIEHYRVGDEIRFGADVIFASAHA
ncbi:MAG TPA: methyltransferase domain-containing protein [Terriglobales bacterium]|nr:methyltransferase domain-containing protein [Terriglobales bacterium]